MNVTLPLRKNNVTLTGNLDASQTMVFVHGYGADQSVWRDVASEFARDYRLVLLDNVGAIGTAPAAFLPHRYLNLESYAADTLDVAAALDLRDAILVGHPAGAMIGLLAAIREPDRFSRLVLIGASPRYLNAEDYRGVFTNADLDGLYSAVMNSYSTWADGFAPVVMRNSERPQLSRHFAEAIKRIPSETALMLLCSIFQSDHRADLASVDHPTLLIPSKDDLALLGEVAEYLHKHIRGSRLRVIDASGHLPHVSAPAEVVNAMREFIC